MALNSLHERFSRMFSLNRGRSRAWSLSCVQILCTIAVLPEQTGFTILEYIEALFPMFTFTVGVAMKYLGEERGEIFQIAVFFTICPYFVGITQYCRRCIP